MKYQRKEIKHTRNRKEDTEIFSLTIVKQLKKNDFMKLILYSDSTICLRYNDGIWNNTR